MNLKQYFLDTFSTKFRKDKHKDFFWVQMLMTIICSLLNGFWIIRDIFVKGIGPNGNLFLIILCRLTPIVLLIPFTIWSFSNKKIEPYFANFLLYINLFVQIVAIHFSGRPIDDADHTIMSLVIFMLEYASVSGIAQIIAQISYPLLMYICSQAVFGFLMASNGSINLLFSNYIVSIICLISASILRFNYYDSWCTKQKLELTSKLDSMTGIWNRKRINDITKEDLLLYDSTILMIDIDNFKSINDNNGHDFGDQAIYDTVSYLKKSFASADIIRYGGDEFLVIISEIIKLSKLKIKLSSNIFRKDITYSAGVAYGYVNDNICGIIKHADIALYKSKETKNCVTLFNDILN